MSKNPPKELLRKAGEAANCLRCRHPWTWHSIARYDYRCFDLDCDCTEFVWYGDVTVYV